MDEIRVGVEQESSHTAQTIGKTADGGRSRYDAFDGRVILHVHDMRRETFTIVAEELEVEHHDHRQLARRILDPLLQRGHYSPALGYPGHEEGESRRIEIAEEQPRVVRIIGDQDDLGA